MPKLSLRISDEESQKIMRQKGDKTISNYIRELVQKDGDTEHDFKVSGHEKYLKRILYESSRAGIAIEAFAEQQLSEKQIKNFSEAIAEKLESMSKK